MSTDSQKVGRIKDLLSSSFPTILSIRNAEPLNMEVLINALVLVINGIQNIVDEKE